MTTTQRYKLTIAYRGTRYHGWQAQPLVDTYTGVPPPPSQGVPTIQETLARTLAGAGLKVALASRTTADLEALAAKTGAKLYACDAAKSAEVEKLFSTLDSDFGAPDVVVYNASARARGPFVDLVPAEVEHAIAVSRPNAATTLYQLAIRTFID